LSASIGIAIYPEDGEDAGTLIKAADAAMFDSKRKGPGAFELYNPEKLDGPKHHPLMQRRSDFEDLREANQRLVNAAKRANKLQARSDSSYRRQIKYLADRVKTNASPRNAFTGPPNRS